MHRKDAEHTANFCLHPEDVENIANFSLDVKHIATFSLASFCLHPEDAEHTTNLNLATFSLHLDMEHLVNYNCCL